MPFLETMPVDILNDPCHDFCESARNLLDCLATITFPLERQLEFPVSGAGGESPSDN